MDPTLILKTLGISNPTAIKPVSGGWDTALWRVEQGDATFALRVFRASQVETCRREVAALGAASAAGLPVPEIHAEGVWEGRPALLLSWCAGEPLLRALGSDPGHAWELGLAFGRMQARIHRVTAPVALREPPNAWIDWAGPEQGALIARLCASDPRDDRLLHLDYHPMNAMAAGTHITGVLDWANARAGDPRADLARTLTILRLVPLPPGTPAIAARVLRPLLRRAWRIGYEREAGPVGDVRLYYAWAGAVLARDLAPKVGLPGNWLTPRHLDRIRRWTAGWKQRLGIPGE